MLETNPRSHIAPRAASGESGVAGSEECDPIARYIPRLGVGADIASGCPGVDVDEAALKPKKSASKCGGAIWRILSSSHLIFLEASVLRVADIKSFQIEITLQLSRVGSTWQPANFNCGTKEAPGTQNVPVTVARRPPIVASIQHAPEIVFSGGDWKVL